MSTMPPANVKAPPEHRATEAELLTAGTLRTLAMPDQRLPHIGGEPRDVLADV